LNARAHAYVALLAGIATAVLLFVFSVTEPPRSKPLPYSAAVAAAPELMRGCVATAVLNARPVGRLKPSALAAALKPSAHKAGPPARRLRTASACGAELCDGVDNDCDGQVDESGAANCTPFFQDDDGDQFGAPVEVGCYCEPRGGLAANDFDCDDAEAQAFPGAFEVCDGEIDNNCDGTFDLCGAFSRQQLQTNDLVVQRFMERPAGLPDADGEWFEIANRTDRPFELMGLEVRDGGFDWFQIDRSLVIPPQGRVVLGRHGDPATNGGMAVDYVYSDFILSNFGDTIELVNGGQLVHRMTYGPR